MRMKEYFMIPEGEKATEKAFRRVLISSVCSIILCMSCLFGSTWAWFTADVVNSGNEIRIATVTQSVTVKKGSDVVQQSADGTYELLPGTYTAGIKLTSDASHTDDLDKTSGSVYAVLVVKQKDIAKCYYIPVTGAQSKESFEIEVLEDVAKVSFSASWIIPDAAELVAGEKITVGQPPVEPTTQPTTQPESPSETQPATQPVEIPQQTQPVEIPQQTQPVETTENIT